MFLCSSPKFESCIPTFFLFEGTRRICVYECEGSMRSGRNRRGKTDARDENRQANWEKKIRNSCASSMETSLSIPTYTDTPSNTVSELCTLPKQRRSFRCEVEWMNATGLSQFKLILDLDLFERNSVFSFITVYELYYSKLL